MCTFVKRISDVTNQNYRKILDTIDTETFAHPDGTPKTEGELAADRRQAYAYAFLMFLSNYLKVSELPWLYQSLNILDRI